MFYSEIYQPGVADFDCGGKLGYEAILRIFENTASRHSDSSGDDIIAESRHGITWVLTDWRVSTQVMPCRHHLGADRLARPDCAPAGQQGAPARHDLGARQCAHRPRFP